MDISDGEQRLVVRHARGFAWAVVGFVVAAIALPTAAVAVAVQFTGIQGAASGNKVEVTKDHQLLTVEASPSSYYTSQVEVLSGTLGALNVGVPAGKTVVVRSVSVSTFSTVNTGITSYVALGLSTDGCATFSTTLSYVDVPFDTTSSNVAVPFTPGLGIPAGKQLCAFGGHTNADLTVSGYLVPAASITTSIHGSGQLSKPTR